MCSYNGDIWFFVHFTSIFSSYCVHIMCLYFNSNIYSLEIIILGRCGTFETTYIYNFGGEKYRAHRFTLCKL